MQGAKGADLLASVREALDLETTAPWALQLVPADNGNLWVQDHLPASPDDRWTIYSPDGVKVGTVTAPRGTTVHMVRGDTVWGSYQDRLDVPYVARYNMALTSHQ